MELPVLARTPRSARTAPRCFRNWPAWVSVVCTASVLAIPATAQTIPAEKSQRAPQQQVVKAAPATLATKSKVLPANANPNSSLGSLVNTSAASIQTHALTQPPRPAAYSSDRVSKSQAATAPSRIVKSSSRAQAPYGMTGLTGFRLPDYTGGLDNGKPQGGAGHVNQGLAQCSTLPGLGNANSPPCLCNSTFSPPGCTKP